MTWRDVAEKKKRPADKSAKGAQWKFSDFGESVIRQLDPYKVDLSRNMRGQDIPSGPEWDALLETLKDGNRVAIYVLRLKRRNFADIDYAIDGSRRVAGAKHWKKQVKAEVIEVTTLPPLAELQALSLMCNAHDPQHWTLNVQWCHDHMLPQLRSVKERHAAEKANEVMTLDVGRRKIGASERAMRVYMTIALLPSNWLQVIRDKRITQDVASQLADPDQTSIIDRDASWDHLLTKGILPVLRLPEVRDADEESSSGPVSPPSLEPKKKARAARVVEPPPRGPDPNDNATHTRGMSPLVTMRLTSGKPDLYAMATKTRLEQGIWPADDAGLRDLVGTDGIVADSDQDVLGPAVTAPAWFQACVLVADALLDLREDPLTTAAHYDAVAREVEAFLPKRAAFEESRKVLES